MPVGKGRKQPPPGYISPGDAGDKLGHSRLYKLVRDKKLQRVVPEGYTHGYFVESEVEAIYQADQAFFNAGSESAMQHVVQDEHAIFSLATADDMDALYAMAIKLFPHTATAEQRRAWLAKEPQGHYVIKTRDGRVLAYLYLLALKRDRQGVPDPDRMKMYLHRQLTSSMIEPDDINQIAPGVSTEIAIAGIGSDPDTDQNARSSYTSWLLYGAARDLERMGREGIVLTRAYAFSETRDGIAMCAKLGMQQWEPPQGKVCTFVSNVQTSTSFLFRRYRRALQDWQASHKPQKHATRATRSRPIQEREPSAAPGDLPAGTLHIQDFLQLHKLKPYRRRIIGYLDSSGNGLQFLAYPKPNRTDESDRYLTSEQQETLLNWLREKHPEVFA